MSEKNAKHPGIPGAPAEKAGRDLAKVNEKLRELVASLRTEKERLAESRAPAAPAAPLPSAEPAVDLE